MQALPVYERYCLSVQEKIGYGLVGIGCTAVLVYLFFRCIGAFLILAPCGAYYYPVFMKNKLAVKRKEKLLLQWKEAILSIGVSLSAGYSVENAFVQTYQELRQRFGEDQMITREFSFIVHQIHMNIPVEKTLADFAERSGLDEVKNFSEIFRISKRAGTDLIKIIGETAELIAARVDVKEEIITLMTSVRLEGKIMNGVPLGILIYIQFSSPLFFQPMYNTLAGQLIMASCLAGYLGICRYSAKLMSIEL